MKPEQEWLKVEKIIEAMPKEIKIKLQKKLEPEDIIKEAEDGPNLKKLGIIEAKNADGKWRCSNSLPPELIKLPSLSDNLQVDIDEFYEKARYF